MRTVRLTPKQGRWLSYLLLFLLLLTYIAAKLHYFRRYDPADDRGYAVEHAPFWIAMVLIGVLLWLVNYLTEKPARD